MRLVDRRGPLGDLLFAHRAARMQSRVFVAPFIDVDQELCTESSVPWQTFVSRVGTSSSASSG
jgi:hypothetical protein